MHSEKKIISAKKLLLIEKIYAEKKKILMSQQDFCWKKNLISPFLISLPQYYVLKKKALKGSHISFQYIY